MIRSAIRRALVSLAVLFLVTCYTPMLRCRGIVVDLIIAAAVRIQTVLTLLGLGDRKVTGNLACVESEFPDKSRTRQRIFQIINAEHQGAIQWNRFLANPRLPIPVSISGREHLDAQVASGKGAILLCYHFDNYRMIPAVLHQHGYDLAVHKEQANQFNDSVWPWVAEYFANRRHQEMTQSPIDFEYHSENITLARLGRKLRKGKSVLITGDGLSGKSFMRVPFLKNAIHFARGPAQFAAIMRVPILPLFLYGPTRDRSTNLLEIHAPIAVDDPSENSIAEAMTRCTGILRESVRKRPCLWLAWSRCNNLVPDEAPSRVQDRPPVYVATE